MAAATAGTPIPTGSAAVGKFRAGNNPEGFTRNEKGKDIRHQNITAAKGEFLWCASQFCFNSCGGCNSYESGT